MSKKEHKHKPSGTWSRRIRTLARWAVRLLTILGAVLLSLDAWLSRTWESLSVDEVLYHLRAPLEGTDMTVVWDYLGHYLPLAVGTVILITIASRITSRRGRGATILATGLAALLSIAMLAGALLDFSERTGLTSYLDMVDEDFIGAHYVDPTEVDIEFPEQKRNIIYIYLESMEMTYSDPRHGGAFPTDVIPELTQLAAEGECFSGKKGTLNGGLVLPGTGWTIAGMFAQTSGVPLKLPFYGNNMGTELTDFFPGLTTFGDILADEGYNQYLLVGSDASFAARDEYFTEHGEYQIYDYVRALDEGYIPAGYHVFWGFEDERLFAKARDIVTEMSQGDAPFNLTMLTVDTHFEDGYVCNLCGDEFGDDQYANVMACSSRQVADFVDWLKQQDFYENTTIVINGDHTTMDKDFCQDVPDDYQRRTYTCILNGAATPEDPEAERSFSTLDLFPTTLAAMGATIEGDRLGLGTDLYASRPTIVEQYGLDYCSAALNRQSEFLNGYSNATLREDLVDMVADKAYLRYRTYTDGEGSTYTGFVVSGLGLINYEVIQSARLELTDSRTGKVSSYDMEVWRENPNHPNNYVVVAPLTLRRDDLNYLSATAYLQVDEEKGEQVFAEWQGTTKPDERKLVTLDAWSRFVRMDDLAAETNGV